MSVERYVINKTMGNDAVVNRAMRPAEYLELAEELVGFIGRSPSMFHTACTIREYLDAAGFTYLPESDVWHVDRGGSYYTVRNNSSVVAFKVGEHLSLERYHFQMTASHADSPTYKVKAVPEIEGPHEFLRLNVEAYGGVVDSTWLDRPLSVAGRVLVDAGERIESRLVATDKPVCLIPNTPPHLNRQINKGFEYNRAVDLCPVFSAGELSQGDFAAMVAREVGVEPKRLLSYDLFLVNKQEPVIWGAAEEFVSAPKLDDLQCAFSSLKAFLAAENPEVVNVYACFDNEEVGSGTKQGARSTLLADVLERVNGDLGFGEQDLRAALAASYLVSCDNAHAVHPGHPELTDALNCVLPNRGVVVKEAASQTYTTDAFSRAVFECVCRKAGVPTQPFANRSDKPGGSTLGNLSNMQVSVHAVDVGLAQLAMHSSYETAGTRDTAYLVRALTTFYESVVDIDGADSFSVR